MPIPKFDQQLAEEILRDQTNATLYKDAIINGTTNIAHATNLVPGGKPEATQRLLKLWELRLLDGSYNPTKDGIRVHEQIYGVVGKDTTPK